MTPPMTPREKVANAIRVAVGEFRMSDGMAVIAANAAFDALASGSGDHADHFGGVTDMVDHAELAKLVDDPAMDFGGFGRSSVSALLAENAALRGEREGWGEHYDRATNLHASTCRDLAEAERKLAEAVGLLRRTTEALGWAWPKALMAMDDHRLLRMKAGHDDIVGQYRSGTSYVGIYQSEVDEIESNGDTLKEARTFLSKDAERG